MKAIAPKENDIIAFFFFLLLTPMMARMIESGKQPMPVQNMTCAMASCAGDFIEREGYFLPNVKDQPPRCARLAASACSALGLVEIVPSSSGAVKIIAVHHPSGVPILKSK